MAAREQGNSMARVSLSLGDTQAATVPKPPAADCKQDPSAE